MEEPQPLFKMIVITKIYHKSTFSERTINIFFNLLDCEMILTMFLGHSYSIWNSNVKVF